jgi:hypothetical protein
MRAPTFAAVVLVVGVVLIGCGGDDDDNGGGGGAEQQGGDITQAAQRLETYLKRNTKNLAGSDVERGQVVTSVTPTNGKLKIFTGLNADVTADDEPAREVCRVARKSGVPEAKGASVVDAGDAELQRC